MTPAKLRAQLIALLGNAPNLAARAGKAIGVTKRTVYRWLSHERAIPPWVVVMLKLARECPKSKRPKGW